METEGQYPMSGEHWTLFDLFNQEDYVTGVFGKWGLGYPGSDGDPKAHGVDDFYGYNCQRYDYLYWEYHRAGGRQAVRKDNWKAVAYRVADGRDIQLYDLSSDPSESRNIADQHPEIVAQMDSIMNAAHVPSEIFPFPTDN